MRIESASMLVYHGTKHEANLGPPIHGLRSVPSVPPRARLCIESVDRKIADLPRAAVGQREPLFSHIAPSPPLRSALLPSWLRSQLMGRDDNPCKDFGLFWKLIDLKHLI